MIDIVLQQTWQQTQIWKVLSDRARAPQPSDGADVVATRLSTFMPDVEAVLGSGETSASDFTLHDEKHGFRVAERMADLIGEEMLNAFSSSELAMLLSSAYLHDIGMTPKRGKVEAHREFLFTGYSPALSDRERMDLQRWLDDNADGVTPPLQPSRDSFFTVDALLTYYSRARHNDWSEEWIRENLTAKDREVYHGWVDDLVQLCRSHHEDYPDLISERYDAKLAGIRGNDLVHRRYLAAVLRLADILDFDIERTPEVVFRHRNVARDSIVYWHKDHEVRLEPDGRSFIFYARPRTAAMFQALRQMADQIDNELAICALMAKEGRFSLAPLFDKRDPRYEWKYEPALKRDIHAKPGSFEEFDGAFHPSPRRLLALLAGTELYGNQMAAARELLQNAFDAVRERIARQRLTELKEFGQAQLATISAQHHVILDFKSVEDDHTLVCTDTGVGMNRAILRERFLTTGSGRSHEDRDLERRCQSHGFTVGRTGQFGIGALSYFMIAGRIHIVTSRNLEAPERDGGWEFSVDGLNDFGELRRSEGAPGGTKVTLHLRREVVGDDADAWFLRLDKYLHDLIGRVPCRFILRRNGENVRAIGEAGWARSAAEIEELYLRKFLGLVEPEQDSSILSTRRREEHRRRAASIDRRRARVRSALRWEYQEGELPEGMGHYRISFPWMKLSLGDSVIYLDIKEENSRLTLAREDMDTVETTAFDLTWNGMDVSASLHVEGAPYIVEIDLAATAGSIEVSREEVVLNRHGEDALRFVGEKGKALAQQWMKDRKESIFAEINRRVFGLKTSDSDDYPLFWTFRMLKGKTFEFRAIKFPIVNENVMPALVWRDQVVESIEGFAGHWQSYFNWADNPPYPTHIVAMSDLEPTLLWTQGHAASPIIAFPPEWYDVICVGAYPLVLWNNEHCPTKTISLSFLQGESVEAGDKESLRTELLKRGEVAQATLIAINGDHDDWWNAEIEQQGSLCTIWREFWGIASCDHQVVKKVDLDELAVHEISCRSWNIKEYETSDGLSGAMPPTGPEWHLTARTRKRRK